MPADSVSFAEPINLISLLSSSLSSLFNAPTTNMMRRHETEPDHINISVIEMIHETKKNCFNLCKFFNLKFSLNFFLNLNLNFLRPLNFFKSATF